MSDEAKQVESAEERSKRIDAIRSNYPSPERVEKLFLAWKNGGKEGLQKVLRDES
jgi:hypothetical protein